MSEEENKKTAKKSVKKTVKKTAKKSGKTNGVKKKAAKKTAKKKSDSAGGERKYILDSVLVINNAQTIHGQMTALVKAKQDIVIDGSTVEMADTSILQLLLAFVKKIQADGKKVTWMSPSSELISRAEMLNLKDQLGLTG